MFVLAHLSDPHIPPLPKPRIAELISKRGLGYLNWWRKRRSIHSGEVLARIVGDLNTQTYDHLAVTGDLINLSLPAEYVRARAWLVSLGAPQDVTLVPGNHDAYVRAVARDPETHWVDFMRGDDHTADGAGVGHAFPFVRRRGPLALIGLSSGVPTGPLLATGHLGSEQLARFAELLDRCGRERLFRVVLIHHPPRSSRSDYLRRLVDAPSFRAALARHGAELVLHGHDHAHSQVWLEGPGRPVPAIGVPSASERPPGEHDAAAYNLYRIEGSAGAWRCEAISRGFSRNGEGIFELKRRVLAAG